MSPAVWPLKRVRGWALTALLAFAGCTGNDPRFRDDTLYIGGYKGRPKEREEKREFILQKIISMP